MLQTRLNKGWPVPFYLSLRRIAPFYSARTTGAWVTPPFKTFIFCNVLVSVLTLQKQLWTLQNLMVCYSLGSRQSKKKGQDYFYVTSWYLSPHSFAIWPTRRPCYVTARIEWLSIWNYNERRILFLEMKFSSILWTIGNKSNTIGEELKVLWQAGVTPNLLTCLIFWKALNSFGKHSYFLLEAVPKTVHAMKIVVFPTDSTQLYFLVHAMCMESSSAIF